jgi:O-Antigen ligase
VSLKSRGTKGYPTVAVRRRHERRTWWLVYGGALFACLIIGLFAYSTAPQPFSLAVVLFLVTTVVAVVRPTLGLYALVLLTVIGDASSAPWYPFAKNLSSNESILFVSNSLKVSPLEVCLAGLVAGWVLQMLTRRNWHVERGRFFWPLVALSGFVVLGFAWGIARGGSTTIGLWEMRPILYLPVLYLLLTNVMTRAVQYERLYWCVMVGVLLNSLLSIEYFEGLSKAQRLDLEALGEHGASLAMNAMLVLFLSAWIFRARSPAKRFLLPVMLVPVAFTYFTAQRRAAVIGLVGALVLVAVVLFWRRRRVFWYVVPVTTLLLTGYVGAFWHSTGSGLGFPALAVKSVVAPNQIDENDRNSSLYRQVETHDVVFTIKTNPLLGIGFGQKFLRPWPLPAISTFILSEYITHNSILWLWMKAGIGGFLAMLYVFSLALRVGARAVRSDTDNDRAALTFTSIAFVFMYAVFTYVDISWDPKNMVLLALAIAQINFASRTVTAAPSTNVTSSKPTVAGMVPVAVALPR